MRDFYPSIEEARAWYTSADLAHDFEHVLRVLNLALKIAEKEATDLEIVYVAALLHDSRGATPGGEGGERMGHHLASARFAGEVLKQASWQQERIEAVQHCIRAHRYRNDGEHPQSLEAKCVFDADKLDVLGAVGVARTIAYATHAGQPFYAKPSEQFLKTGKRLPEEPHSAYHEYLFKLRHVKDRLFTLTGKQVAAQRDEILHKFFKQLQAECEGEA